MIHVTADNLPRLMNCQGSRLMEPAFPSDAGDQTVRNEGIAADYMATTAFNGTPLASLIDTKAPNGVFMTSEMADHVGEYLSALDCGEVQADTSYGCDTWRIGARCDHIKYDPVTHTITVDDFKYGWRLVEPECNWTLLAHAIGYMVIRYPHLTLPAAVLRIHQPRPSHPDGKLREWRITGEELSAYASQIDFTLSNLSDELTTNIEWCGTCHALATCPAARKARMNAIDAAARALPDALTPEQLSYELDTLRNATATLEAQFEALQEMASYQIKSGKAIPNYYNEDTYGNRAWKPGMTPEFLKMITGVDLSKPGTVTPAEAQRRNIPENVVTALTYRPKRGQKLVRIDADKLAKRILKKGNTK